MTDTREAAEAALAASTVLDAGTPNEKPLSDAAFEAPPAEPAKPEEPKQPSSREVIAKTLDDLEAKDKATTEKAEKAADDAKAAAEKAKDEDKAKAEKPRSEDGKFAKAEEPKGEPEKAEQGVAEKPAAGQEGDGNRQSEGRKHVEPPARFLPEARTKWPNVPNEVKAEVHRVAQEYEAEIEKHRASAERYEEIRQFDEQARQNGRGGVKDSLAKMVQIEQALAKSPVHALEMILREAGPRKPDGSPVSLYEVAQHIAKLTPEQFQQNMRGLGQQAPQQPQQRQPAPEVAAIAQELKALRTELAQTKLSPVLERFAAERPDYNQLQPQIAAVLKSGVVEQLYGNLTPEQKLSEAYRMAGGQYPSSRSTPEPAAPAPVSAAEPDRPVDPAGQKSVRGAPSSGFDPQTRRPKSNREAAAAALSEVAGF